MSNAPYLSNTSVLYSNLSLLKIHEIYVYMVAIFMYKIVQGDALKIYKSMFEYNFEIHTRFTRRLFDFHLPKVKSNLSKRHIRFSGSKIWNNISKHVLCHMNLPQFKSFVKKGIVNHIIQL